MSVRSQLTVKEIIRLDQRPKNYSLGSNSGEPLSMLCSFPAEPFAGLGGFANLSCSRTNTRMTMWSHTEDIWEFAFAKCFMFDGNMAVATDDVSFILKRFVALVLTSTVGDLFFGLNRDRVKV